MLYRKQEVIFEAPIDEGREALTHIEVEAFLDMSIDGRRTLVENICPSLVMREPYWAFPFIDRGALALMVVTNDDEIVYNLHLLAGVLRRVVVEVMELEYKRAHHGQFMTDELCDDHLRDFFRKASKRKMSFTRAVCSVGAMRYWQYAIKRPNVLESIANYVDPFCGMALKNKIKYIEEVIINPMEE